MYFTIDRITAGVAVLLDDADNTYRLPICEIPFAVEEGDLLAGEAGGTQVTVTHKDTAELERRMEARRAARRNRRG